MVLKAEVKKILQENKANLQNEDYAPLFKDALPAGVLSEVLDAIGTKREVPTELLTKALKEYYIDNNTALSAEEKSAKAKFIQYLINKYQISIFESILNNQ